MPAECLFFLAQDSPGTVWKGPKLAIRSRPWLWCKNKQTWIIPDRDLFNLLITASEDGEPRTFPGSYCRASLDFPFESFPQHLSYISWLQMKVPHVLFCLEWTWRTRDPWSLYGPGAGPCLLWSLCIYGQDGDSSSGCVLPTREMLPECFCLLGTLFGESWVLSWIPPV